VDRITFVVEEYTRQIMLHNFVTDIQLPFVHVSDPSLHPLRFLVLGHHPSFFINVFIVCSFRYVFALSRPIIFVYVSVSLNLPDCFSFPRTRVISIIYTSLDSSVADPDLEPTFDADPHLDSHKSCENLRPLGYTPFNASF
jgi:hypothetical protein